LDNTDLSYVDSSRSAIRTFICDIGVHAIRDREVGSLQNKTWTDQQKWSRPIHSCVWISNPEKSQITVKTCRSKTCVQKSAHTN